MEARHNRKKENNWNKARKNFWNYEVENSDSVLSISQKNTGNNVDIK